MEFLAGREAKGGEPSSMATISSVADTPSVLGKRRFDSPSGELRPATLLVEQQIKTYRAARPAEPLMVVAAVHEQVSLKVHSCPRPLCLTRARFLAVFWQQLGRWNYGSIFKKSATADFQLRSLDSVSTETSWLTIDCYDPFV